MPHAKHTKYQRSLTAITAPVNKNGEPKPPAESPSKRRRLCAANHAQNDLCALDCDVYADHRCGHGQHCGRNRTHVDRASQGCEIRTRRRRLSLSRRSSNSSSASNSDFVLELHGKTSYEKETGRPRPAQVQQPSKLPDRRDHRKHVANNDVQRDEQKTHPKHRLHQRTEAQRRQQNRKITHQPLRQISTSTPPNHVQHGTRARAHHPRTNDNGKRQREKSRRSGVIERSRKSVQIIRRRRFKHIRLLRLHVKVLRSRRRTNLPIKFARLIRRKNGFADKYVLDGTDFQRGSSSMNSKTMNPSVQ